MEGTRGVVQFVYLLVKLPENALITSGLMAEKLKTLTLAITIIETAQIM